MGRTDRGLPHAHPSPQVGVCHSQAPTPAASPSCPHPPSRPCRQRRDSGGGGSSVFEAQESWERLSDGGKSSAEEPGDSPPLRHCPRGLAPPSVFGDQPDLTCLIDTNFSVRPWLSEPTQPEPRHRAGCGRSRDNPGYDFSRLVQRAYQQEGLAPVHAQTLCPPSPGPTLPQAPEDEGGSPPEKGTPALAWAPSAEGSIWSLELQGNLIVVGRSSGRLEVGRGLEGGAGGWRRAGAVASPAAAAHGPGPAGVGRRGGHTALQQRAGLLGNHCPRLPGQKVSAGIRLGPCPGLAGQAALRTPSLSSLRVPAVPLGQQEALRVGPTPSELQVPEPLPPPKL